MKTALATIALATLVSLGCGSEKSITKASVTVAGKLDNPSAGEACTKLTGSPVCDLCEEMGWYSDGECDTICPQPDPECSGLADAGVSVPDAGQGLADGGSAAACDFNSFCAWDEDCKVDVRYEYPNNGSSQIIATGTPECVPFGNSSGGCDTQADCEEGKLCAEILESGPFQFWCQKTCVVASDCKNSPTDPGEYVCKPIQGLPGAYGICDTIYSPF